MSYINSTVAECYQVVREFFKDHPEKVTVWFNTPNPLLGGVTPVDMIMAGREQKLLRFIKDAVEGNL